MDFGKFKKSEGGRGGCGEVGWVYWCEMRLERKVRVILGVRGVMEGFEVGE